MPNFPEKNSNIWPISNEERILHSPAKITLTNKRIEVIVIYIPSIICRRDLQRFVLRNVNFTTKFGALMSPPSCA